MDTEFQWSKECPGPGWELAEELDGLGWRSCLWKRVVPDDKLSDAQVVSELFAAVGVFRTWGVFFNLPGFLDFAGILLEAGRRLQRLVPEDAETELSSAEEVEK